MWLTQRHVHVGAIAHARCSCRPFGTVAPRIPIFLSSLSQINKWDWVVYFIGDGRVRVSVEFSSIEMRCLECRQAGVVCAL
jgi:hypothetical protein